MRGDEETPPPAALEVALEPRTAYDDLEMVRDFVLRRGKLGRATAESVDDLLEDHNSRLKILLVALGRMRADQAPSFARSIDGVQQVAIERALTGDMSNRDLVALLKALYERERANVDYVGALIAASLPTKYNEPGYESEVERALTELGVDPPNVQTRRSLANLIARVAKKISDTP